MKFKKESTVTEIEDWENITWDPVSSIKVFSDDYPIIANMRFKNIQPQNCEDILWQNLVDDESEIVQNDIGVSVTQSIHYTKIMSKRIILTRWIGRTTEYGPEFVIGVGDSVAGSKHIHKIVRGNEVQGVRFETPIKVGEISSSQKLDCGSIGMMNGVLVYYDGKDYREILVGDKVEEPE